MTLAEFPAFAVTVDLVVLTVRGDELQVLTVRRGEPPYEGEWALPGGFVLPNEGLDQAAARELLEETGHGARDWRYLGVMHPCVGYSNERIEIFLARGLYADAGGQQLDHGELLDLLNLRLEDAVQAVRSGEITDAKTISALFWAEKIVNNGW